MEQELSQSILQEPAGAVVTPMLRQYWQIKSEIEDKDTILFFRLGDFYEMFFEDAKIASEILDITLTSRNKNSPNPVPLCGIPFHSADGYISKLLQGGKKVAICEQVEDPKTAVGVVKREVIKILTPGVLLEQENLIAGQNNYLCAINVTPSKEYLLAFCDVSTGEFRATTIRSLEVLSRELARIEPKEVLLPRSLAEDAGFANIKQFLNGAMITVLDDPKFVAEIISGIDTSDVPKEALSVVAVIFDYLNTTHKAPMGHIQRVLPYKISEYMVIDEAAKRNLELIRTMADGSAYGSLIWLLDKTRTAMGGRALRKWMFYPLVAPVAINKRLDAVASIKDNFQLSENLKGLLVKVADIERITSRIVTQIANARDLVALKETLKTFPAIKEELKSSDGVLGEIFSKIDPCGALVERIESAVADEPPLSLKDGGLIKSGINKDLDELRAISSGGKDFIASLEAKEKSATGINSLKVRYNKVFGYYIEITHTHAEKAPAHYIRKQTLTNAERFITPELKEYEEKVLGAEEKIRRLEYDIFCSLRLVAAEFAERIKSSAEAIGTLDALLSLSEVASKNRYIRPIVDDSDELKITGGRHPIVEQLCVNERFVPNDLYLDAQDNRMMIITGPNMAGKSTIMRQSALIVLLAQMGSFVPAGFAKVGVVDRIFTRVGASDNLIRGQSTFMVEMSEAAVILKEATNKSLILIDEIGRGTSTYDGVSIAWAVAEFINDRVKAKTLFATHYHELTDLADSKKGIKNFNVAVKEWNDQIIFLRKLVEGGVNRSYGIQVARLAGIPQEVIVKAKEILVKLEKGEMALTGGSTQQMGLFEPASTSASSEKTNEVANILKAVDISVITPIEAMNILHKIKGIV